MCWFWQETRSVTQKSRFQHTFSGPISYSTQCQWKCAMTFFTCPTSFVHCSFKIQPQFFYFIRVSSPEWCHPGRSPMTTLSLTSVKCLTLPMLYLTLVLTSLIQSYFRFYYYVPRMQFVILRKKRNKPKLMLCYSYKSG